MAQKKNVAIIGGGRIGQSVFHLLERYGRANVRLWDIDQEKMHRPVTLQGAVSNADFIFLCVPSWALRSVVSTARKFAKKRTLFISFAKGIEAKTHARVDEILKAELKGFPFAVFGGPFMAEEIDRGLFGVGVVGTKSKNDFLKLANLFHGTHAKLHYSGDAKGVAISGVLKNLYAVGLGIADGLNWGTNAKGWLMAEMYEEMVCVGEALGAKREIVMLAGGGDLATSGFSPYSRNRKTGEEILAGRAHFIKSESLASYPSVKAMLGKNLKKYRLLATLSGIVEGRLDARKEFEKLL